MKCLIIAALAVSASIALTGCWQSPANCSLVIGFHRETVRMCEAPATGSATNPVVYNGHGNNARVFVKQSNVAYKSPATSASNTVSPSLTVPLTN